MLGLSLLLLSEMVGAEYHTTSSQLSQLLLGFHTYQANFNQITFDSRKDRVIQKSQGRMMIIRPGYFRWEIESPTKQFIITNKNTLWVYDVDLSQVTQQPLVQETNINLVSLLSGSIKDLNQKFTITLTSTANTIIFQLVPILKKTLDFHWIRLKFAKNQLTEMTLLNNLDEENIFQFNQIKVNAPLSSALFEFKPLHCCDVIKQ